MCDSTWYPPLACPSSVPLQCFRRLSPNPSVLLFPAFCCSLSLGNTFATSVPLCGLCPLPRLPSLSSCLSQPGSVLLGPPGLSCVMSSYFFLLPTFISLTNDVCPALWCLSPPILWQSPAQSGYSVGFHSFISFLSPHQHL